MFALVLSHAQAQPPRIDFLFMTSAAANNRPPQHIAVIMDGNGRWAQQRALSRSEGHKQGLQATKRLVEYTLNAGIAYLTVFAFSQENWQRPKTEINALLALFAETITNEGAAFQKQDICVRFMGDLSRFPKPLQVSMASLQQLTKNGKRLVLTLAIGYSGRWDIVQAAARAAAAGAKLTEDNFDEWLATAHCPPLDILIRTGGEQRISNFMLWQAAYTELHFTDTLWPDFAEGDFAAALADFYSRHRRFGRVENDTQRSHFA